ncbi:MAG: DnaJ domain-containing protein [Pseudonocardiaceae bacterium]
MTTASTTFVHYYEILGLPPTADADAIERKIKEELRIWRKRQGSPDLSKRQEAELRMQHLVAAREVLSDPGKRTAYDQRLATHRASAPRPSDASGGRNWVVLAEEYLAQNDYHSASYAAREATQVEGNSALAWNLRARANAGLGQLNDAAYEARQAAGLETTNAQYQFDLGSICEQLQRWPDALACYEAAARLEPDAFLYQLSIAGVYLQNNAPEQAMPILEQVHQARPNEEMVNYYLANALRDLAERVPKVRTGDHYTITSPQEIEQMETLLRRAVSLEHGDRDISDNLQKIADYIETCKQTKFSVPTGLVAFGLRGVVAAFVVPILLVLGGLGSMGSSPGGGFVMLLIGGLAIFGLIKLCWVPGWKHNARVSR